MQQFPLLGIYSGEMKIFVSLKTCTWMVTAALFRTVQRWKQPKCPSAGEQTDGRWDPHSLERYLAMQRKQTTDTHNMEELQKHYTEQKKPDAKDYVLYDCIHMNCLERRWVVGRGWGRMGYNWKRAQQIFWGRWKYSKTGCCHTALKLLYCALKIGEFDDM